MAKQTSEKRVDVSKAIRAANILLKAGASEMRFQNMLDRYQLANYKADYSEDARTKRLLELRAKAEKLDAEFKGVLGDDGKPVARVSNWQPLANYFNETLAHLKESDFAIEAGERARRDMEKATITRKLSKEQETVIITYHKNRANANWDKVQQIRAILDYKGLLKKAAPKVEETAAELQEKA